MAIFEEKNARKSRYVMPTMSGVDSVCVMIRRGGLLRLAALICLWVGEAGHG
jgi:hypothetical protein